MRNFLSFAALFLSLFSSGLQAEVYKDERSGIEFPDAIGDFKRIDVKPYEYEPGKQGVAVGYGYQDTAVTVYVRATPAEMAQLTSADFVQETVDQIKEMEKVGYFAGVRFSEFPAGNETPGWNTMTFTGETQGRAVDSFISCKAESGYMVKIRATTGEGRGQKLLGFLTELKETLNKRAR